MAKKVFTDESLSTFVDEIKAYADEAVSTKANASHTHTIANITNLQSTLDGKAASSHTHTVANISDLTATAAELNYMDGVTSSVQTQLDGKAASSHNHAASNITSGTLSSDRLPTVPVAKGGTGATTAAAALTNLGITATAAELNKMDGITATTAELNYVDGVTSSIQTQLDAKQATITGGATTITSSNLTASRALVSDSSGKVAVSAVTSTELGYLDGVTSNVQTQLDGKSSTSHTHSAATTSANGFMSAADKTKLDGIVEATQSTAGLLSAEDKMQLDYGGIPIVTTAGTGAAYTATVDGINALTVGTKITIVPHTVSTATQPTLNVNSLGAKAIRQPITYNTSATSVGPIAAWLVANKPVTVQYNGTYWTTIDIPRPSAQYLYGAVPIANGGTGATDAATALSNLGAATPPSSKQVTLSASGWDSSALTQTVTCSGILADETAQVITVAPASSSMTAVIESGAYCSAQGADSLTFTCTTVPTAALVFNVSWQACNYIS